MYWSLSTRRTRRSSAWPIAAGRAGDSLWFWPRLRASRPSSAGVAGNRSRLPTKESPRPKRASSWLITHSPTCSTLDAGRTVPLPSGHQGLPKHTSVVAPKLRNDVMTITSCGALSPEAWAGRNSVARKDERPVVGNDRPLLTSPRGIWSKPWVCGKGFNERLGNRWRTWGALFITCATCSGTCNVAYLTLTTVANF